MKIERIKKDHHQKFLDFLNSLDEESLNTYTRWRTNFQPEKIAKKIVSENILDKEIGWVAIEDNEIAGYEHLNFSSNIRQDVVKEGFIVGMKFMGKGIGSLLKKKCISESIDRKLHKIIALVYENNGSSLHIDLKHKFLIGGIFFNEEKFMGKSQYLIYLERPIRMQVTQDSYFDLLRYYYDKFKNKNFNKTFFNSDYKIHKLDKDELTLYGKKIIPIMNKISDTSSKIIIISSSEKKFESLGFLEFFKSKEKEHVAKFVIHNHDKCSPTAITYLIKEVLKLSNDFNLEKIWINLPEFNNTLIHILINFNFIIEAIAIEDCFKNGKTYNTLSLAYHTKSDYKKNQIHLMKYLLKNFK